ncbi:hypothetical protein FISHEDRAFT_59281 [Fistulina hepatica ATCC 64428]|uniref:DUF6532 domain-containing protein n=1 Tax=Fistulina hepatica ATCC 64428 TaxID=1128425 RepID=A0A0D7AAU5_9AGAR|nr:hypothetical protein FISHEDRAFT_59281 [Fistulina hepatica ATCC 64428]
MHAGARACLVCRTEFRILHVDTTVLGSRPTCPNAVQFPTDARDVFPPTSTQDTFHSPQGLFSGFSGTAYPLPPPSLVVPWPECPTDSLSMQSSPLSPCFQWATATFDSPALFGHGLRLRTQPWSYVGPHHEDAACCRPATHNSRREYLERLLPGSAFLQVMAISVVRLCSKAGTLSIKTDNFAFFLVWTIFLDPHAYARYDLDTFKPIDRCRQLVTATRKAAAGARDFVTGHKKHEERAEQRQRKDMLREQAQPLASVAKKAKHPRPPRPPPAAFSDESSNDEGPAQPVPKTVGKKMIQGVSAAKATKVPVKRMLASKSGPMTERTAIDQFDNDNSEVSSNDGADVTSQEDNGAVDEDEDLDELDDTAIRATLDTEASPLSDDPVYRAVATGADESDEDNVSNDDDVGSSTVEERSAMSLTSDAPPPTSDSDGIGLEYDSQEDEEDVQAPADVKHTKKRSHRQVTDDDLDAEFDDLLPPEPVHVVKKKCSRRREEAIKAEVPQWVDKAPASSEDMKVEADIVFENAFPEHTDKIVYQRNALISALHTDGFPVDEEKRKDIEKRLVTDVAFVQVLGNLVWGRVPQFHSALRSRGAQALAHYQLGVGQNCKENGFCHRKITLMTARPSETCSVCSLFTGPETNEEHPSCKSLQLDDRPRRSSPIHSHIMTLGTLLDRNGAWYHRLVSTLYDKLVFSSQKNVAMQATPSDMLASIEILEL